MQPGRALISALRRVPFWKVVYTSHVDEGLHANFDSRPHWHCWHRLSLQVVPSFMAALTVMGLRRAIKDFYEWNVNSGILREFATKTFLVVCVLASLSRWPSRLGC